MRGEIIDRTMFSGLKARTEMADSAVYSGLGGESKVKTQKR